MIMLSEKEKTAALERVKRELRSILISSKHGVPLYDVKKDYELLSCNPLPYRDLGFKDVQSFMRSMPDVATEIRSSSGDTVYKAVCDESTAHIQKLVSNQASKKKTRGIARGRRGGYFRGGLSRGARGGRGRGDFTYKGPPLRGDRGAWRGRGMHHSTSGTSRFSTARSRNARVLPGDNEESWEDELDGKNGSKQRAVLGNIENDLHNSSVDDYEDSCSTDHWDKENGNSPFQNIKIGINRTGRRIISLEDDYMDRTSSQSTQNIDYFKDLRHLLNRKRDVKLEDSTRGTASSGPFASRQHQDQGKGVSSSMHHGADTDDGGGRGNEYRRPVAAPYANTNNNRAIFLKDMPPRLARKQQASNQAEVPSQLPPRPIPQASNDLVQRTEDKNWIPPENGERYLQAFHNYFAGKGLPSPEISVVPGKVKKQCGFYGRVEHNGELYYEVEIMQTEEEAKQSAARAFCLKNNIHLSSEEPEKTISSPDEGTQQVEEGCSQASASVDIQTSAPALGDCMQKLYKMLPVPNGLFVRAVPDQYKSRYNESIPTDFMEEVEKWPDFFNVETLAIGCCIIYAMPNAPVAAWQPDAAAELQPTAVAKTATALTKHRSGHVVPKSKVFPIGTELQVMFSYANGVDSLFLQLAETEDLVYDVDAHLTQNCPNLPVPELASVGAGSLVAALYLDNWYRAEVLTVVDTVVHVYFIDYGNSEKVNVECVREIPKSELTLNTQPLAVRCALRKTQEGEWLKAIPPLLTMMAEACPLMTAKVLGYDGETCIIDLHTTKGELINSMLIHQPEEGLPYARSPGKGDPRSPSGNVSRNLFAKDPEPLELPVEEVFAVYICRIMSESSVLLRIIDSNYSDRLDKLESDIAENFYTWPEAKEIKRSNIYACVCPDDDDDDEEEDEDGESKSKFYRVRVLTEDKENKTCEVYFPDHGDEERVSTDQLREISPELNTSLPYQAILATLHGLQTIPDKHRAVATEILIKLIMQESTVYQAGRREGAGKDGSPTVGQEVINRVRKIISCMSEMDATKVADIYAQVYKEPLDNVQEVIKHIPGYGYWKDGLEVELIDTSHWDVDLSVNVTVLAVINQLELSQADMGGARGVDDILRELLGSSSLSLSLTDSDSLHGSGEGDQREKKRLQCEPGPQVLGSLAGDELKTPSLDGQAAAMGGTHALPQFLPGDSEKEARQDRVRDYVREQARAADALPSPTTPVTPKSIYTWTNPKLVTPNLNYSTESSSPAPPTSSHLSSGQRPLSSELTGAPSSICDIPSLSVSGETVPLAELEESASSKHHPPLPNFWEYKPDTFNLVFIMYAESPSNFVATPYEKMEVFAEMESRIYHWLSNPQKSVSSLSKSCLYAVKKLKVCRRALYVAKLGNEIQVFYPDHFLFDSVLPSELFELPEEFYKEIFLARKMYLGALIPSNQDWSEAGKLWFLNHTSNKPLYAFIQSNSNSSTNNNNNNSIIEGADQRIPKSLNVLLVDTSGDEDCIIDEQMCLTPFAKRSPTMQ